MEVILALHALGAEVNQAKVNGCTSAYIAAQKGHVEVVEALRALGVGMNQAKNSGCTAIYIAAQNGHVEVVRALRGLWGRHEAGKGT